MDRENSIDDILKMLKNTVENSERSPVEESISDSSKEEMSADMLKEKLRMQFMQTEDSFVSEGSDDEYAIDESFVAEAMELAEEEPESEPRDDRETREEESYPEQEEIFAEQTYSEPEQDTTEDSVVELEEEIEEEIEEELDEDVSAQNTDEIIEDETDDDLPWYDKMPWEEKSVSAPESELEDETYEAQEIFAEVEDDIEDLALLDGEDQSSDFDEEDDVIEKFEEIESFEDIVRFDSEDADEYTEAEPILAPNSDPENDTILSEFYREEKEGIYTLYAQERSKKSLDEPENEEDFEENNDFEDTLSETEQSDNDLTVEIPVFGQASVYAQNAQSPLEQDEILTDDFFDSSAVVENESEGYSSDEVDAIVDFTPDTNDAEVEVRKRRTPVWRRLLAPVCVSMIAILTLLVELLPIFKAELSGIFDYVDYPLTYIFIDVQLLLLAVLICREKLLDGLKHLFTPLPNIHSVCAIMVLFSFLYCLFACFASHNGLPYLYSAPSAICLAFDSIASMLKDMAKEKAIFSLSSGRPVYTLLRSQGNHSCADKMYMGGVDPDKSIYVPARVKDGSFEKIFSEESKTDKTVSYSLTPIFVFSAVMFVLSMVLQYDFSVSLNAFAVTFMLLVPASALVSGFLPFYIASRRLARRECYIASPKVANRISDCDIVVFGDRHLFSACSAHNSGIKLYSDKDVRKLFSCLGAVYIAIGGPMENVFSELAGGHSAEIIRIARNGVEALIDGKTNIILGGEGYLSRYGISVPDPKASKSDKLSVLYVAMDGVLCAKISLNYKTEPIFEELVNMLGDNGISAAVETYDPIISSAYVSHCRKNKKYNISVIHKNKSDYCNPEKPEVSALRAGVFAVSSRLKLVELAVICKRLARIEKINRIVRLGYFLLGVVSATLLTVFGVVGSINMLCVLAAQLVFSVIFALIGTGLMPDIFDKTN